MTPNRQSSAVIVFVRAPRKGRVKTRLARTLGHAAALELYRRFVADILGMLAQTGRNLRIFFDPADARGEVAAWLGSGYALFGQQGRTLGEKMHNAFVSTFDAGISRAVLIGTDSPDLSPEIIAGAFDALEQHPAVIGPASDGGYYLVGFDAKGYIPAVFDDIFWSTDKVFDTTMKRFGAHGIQPCVLSVRSDIDTARDLIQFVRNDRRNPDDAPGTMAYIHSNSELMHFIRENESISGKRG